MTRHLMLDLETLSTQSNAMIVGLGAVVIEDTATKDMTVVGSYRAAVNPSLGNIPQDKFHIDPSTVLWWLRQSPKARKLIYSADTPLPVALEEFSSFVGMIKPTYIWGNGASFDNLILANAYKILGLKQPWTYKQDMCYRTFKNLKPLILMNVIEEPHTAYGDAYNQALHLYQLLREGNGI
jgi:hypothetical protein